MKKMNLKIFMAVAALFVTVGLFAQSTDVPGTAAQYDETVTTTYMMEGTTVPVFAEPDGYFHPSYDPDVAGSLTAGFTWTWSEATTTLTFGPNNAEDNYNTISAAAGDAGTYTVNVVENAPAAWGSCNDGTGENLTVVVVAQPDAELTNDLGDAGSNAYSGCLGDASLPASVSATISNGWQNYRLVWTLEIKTLNADGTNSGDFYDTDKIAIAALAEEYTPAAPQDVALLAPQDITSVAGGYTIIDGLSTVYTYTLTSINDQASRFGEFIGMGGVVGTDDTFTYYPISEVVTITVHPTPNTGPIYHIDAGWAN